MRIAIILVLAACSESGSRPPCTPVPLARADVWGGQIAVDDQFIYWSERVEPRIVRAERPDGSPTTLANLGAMPQLQFGVGMAASNGTVHWTAQSLVDGQQSVFATTAQGATSQVVLGCFGPALTADGDTVYALGCSEPRLLTIRPGMPPAAPQLPNFATGLVAGGGAAQTNVNQSLVSIALDGTITTIVPQTFTFPIARHGDTIFLANNTQLMSVPVTGGEPVLVAELPNSIDGSVGAADATHVYVRVLAAGGAERDLFAVPRSPGATPRFLATVDNVSSFVVADEGLYWANFGAPPNGGVFRLDRCAYE